MLRWAWAQTLPAWPIASGLSGSPGGTNLSWGDWAHFVAYTAKVNGFLPTALAHGSRSLPRWPSLRSARLVSRKWIANMMQRDTQRTF